MAQVIPIVYLSTEAAITDLRDVVFEALVSMPSLADKPEIETAVDSVGGLAWRLFKMKR